TTAADGREGEWSGRAVEWRGQSLWILDQRRLPRELVHIDAAGPAQVAKAIRTMAVRGAPLLGIVAGYGMALAALASKSAGPKGLLRDLERAGKVLRESRPTATNIDWAVGRVQRAAERSV